MSSQNKIQNLKDFYGQKVIKDRLRTLFENYDRTKKFPSSIFIFGPVGTGKSTLAEIIAKKLQRSISPIFEIKNQADFISLIIGTRENILVLDNLENFQKESLKTIYPLITEKAFWVKNSEGKEIKIGLSDKAIIGLSDRAGIVPKIIRDNFQEIWHLENYKVYEIRKIILAAAKREKTELEKDAALELAHASRKNPQRGLLILDKTVEEAKNQKKEKIDLSFAQKVLAKLTIDRIGLEQFDRDIIKTIIEKFSGGPVGIEVYAARLKETPWNIEEIYEPYLIEIGFLRRTPRGRIATRAAHQYFGYQYAASNPSIKTVSLGVSRKQKKLF